MNNNEISTRPTDGVFKKNPIFEKMIAITAAVLVTKTVACAAIFSMVLLIVLVLSSVIANPIFGGKKGNTYRAVHMVIAAGFTSAAELVLLRVFPSLHSEIALHIPLIVICATLISSSTDSEGFFRSTADSLFSGIGYGIALILISALRELLSTGRIFAFADYPGVTVFAEWFEPIEVLAEAAGSLIFVGCALGVVRMIAGSKREADARRQEEFERIKRGEHETLVLDEDGIVVLRSTIMRIEREIMEVEALEQIELPEAVELTISDDDIKFEFESFDPEPEKEDEDVIFEDCDND
ncbi:MAG: hypothetical protein J6L71_05070 [Clostridia bacterium]|nr:hypothetical protein [Clostridia bacterium]